MSNPVTIHHDERTITTLLGVSERPSHVNYPIRGLPWDIVNHKDYCMSVQQIDFLGNHMQLIEMEAMSDAGISFTINSPTAFMVIMIEGFVKFHREELVVSYAMAGVMYMTYNPRADFQLTVSPGKHAMMVISVEKEWMKSSKRHFPELAHLVGYLHGESDEIVVLPMCRFAQPVMDLWESMRIVRSNPFMHRAELVVGAAKLISFYHGRLESENCVKGQLSADKANRMFMYVESNYSAEKGVSVNQVGLDLGISKHKVEEYARFLFGKTLHKYVRDLRMAKAARLLRLTNLSVPDIATSVGHANLPHFYDVFQRYFGMSPILYRNNENEKEQY